MTDGNGAEPGAGESTVRAGVHLWDYVEVIERRRRALVLVFAMVLAVAGLRTLLTVPVFQGTAQVLIEHQSSSVLAFKDVSEVDTSRDDYYQTQYRLLQSRAVARRAVEKLRLLEDPEFGGPRPAAQVQAALAAPPGHDPALEAVITEFLARLSVEPVKNSRLVAVGFLAGRADLAARAANAVADAYIEQTLEIRAGVSAQAAAWLATQRAEQQKKVAQAEAELEAVKQKGDLVGLGERRAILEQKLKDLGAALTTLGASRLEKEALLRHMASAPDPVELPEVRNSSLVQTLRQQLAEQQREEAKLVGQYLDEHPQVLRVRRQIQQTRNAMAAEARAVVQAAERDYRGTAAREESLRVALEGVRRQIQDLNHRAVDVDALERSLQASKDLLAGLATRQQQADVTQALRDSNIRVVDPAITPDRPVRPRPLREMVLALVLAAVLALAVAGFLEYMDSTIRTPDDVRAHLEAPLLGVIPELAANGGGRPIVATGAVGPFAEGFRVTRTALAYTRPEPGSRVLVVTSTGPGEGKSVCAMNLALTLASPEQRVLLVDADLRNPTVHTALHQTRAPGLSDVIVGRATTASAIRRLPGRDLDFLPCGTRVPSPADLVNTAALAALLADLRGSYDWIIVDSPPVGPVPDALVLAPRSDGVIMVVGAEMIPRRAVLENTSRAEKTGARVLGVVLNRVQLARNARYYLRYYGHQPYAYAPDGATAADPEAPGETEPPGR